jgi:hypothetical protein
MVSFMPRTRTAFLLGLLLVVAIAGCSTPSMTMTFPDYVLNAPPTVREAYEYAVAHPDELTNYPCFCGCGRMGHTSNQDCFIKDVSSEGFITFDSHAAGCGICVDIAQDAMRLRAEGQSAREVRAYIDAQYGSFGPSTDTPLPEG